MVKVIHFISSFSAGGAEVYVKNLVIGLKNAGGEPLVFGLDDAPLHDGPRREFQRRFIAELEINGIPWGLIGSRARRDPGWGLRRFRSVLRAADPDLVHTHLTYAAVYACLATRKRPVVFTHHSTPVRTPWIHKWILRHRLTHYIAVSASGRDALVKQANVSPERISLIFNGVDLTAFAAYPGSRTVGKAPVIIAVGSLRPEKNHELLLAAMAIVVEACRREGRQEPQLQIVGDGARRRQLEERCRRMDLNDHVQFLGVRTDVSGLLSAADLFVMSSTWEGLSIALLEALAAGLPVVATDVGGNREIVDDGVCGYLTRPADARDLAEKLLRFIREPDLRSSFAAQARARSQLFSLARSIQEHTTVYRELTTSVANE